MTVARTKMGKEKMGKEKNTWILDSTRAVVSTRLANELNVGVKNRKEFWSPLSHRDWSQISLNLNTGYGMN